MGLADKLERRPEPWLEGETLTVLREPANNTTVTMFIVTHEMGFARELETGW